jgi:hypothetical protein
MFQNVNQSTDDAITFKDVDDDGIVIFTGIKFLI